jgi:DNA-binding PadR family transcriptional regulator
MSPSVQELLEAWEGNYKKGLLTFWLLLLLHGREAYAFEMSRLVTENSQGTVTADENSIYRALNRFQDMGIVKSTWQESDVGPPRRYYRLSEKGLELLQAFVRRNILLFQNQPTAGQIQAVLDGTSGNR